MCANEGLCSLFPNVYNIAREKSVLMGWLWKAVVMGRYRMFNLTNRIWIGNFVNFFGLVNVNQTKGPINVEEEEIRVFHS